MTLRDGGKPWLTPAESIKKGVPVTPTKLPINAVILQRNGSGQAQTTHSSAEQHQAKQHLNNTVQRHE